MPRGARELSTNNAAPPENANAFPGADLNTAGGRVKEANVTDALRAIKLEDFRELHKKPCVRDALLPGIGAGFAVGGMRAIMGISVFRACSWAVSTFCIGSVLMYEFCQRRRQLERQGMQRIVEVIDRKKSEKRGRAEAAREARNKTGENS